MSTETKEVTPTTPDVKPVPIERNGVTWNFIPTPLKGAGTKKGDFYLGPEKATSENYKTLLAWLGDDDAVVMLNKGTRGGTKECYDDSVNEQGELDETAFIAAVQEFSTSSESVKDLKERQADLSADLTSHIMSASKAGTPPDNTYIVSISAKIMKIGETIEKKSRKHPEAAAAADATATATK